MKIQPEYATETEFIGDLLVDPEMLQGDPSKCKTEVGKRALDTMARFEDNPTRISFGDLQDIATSQGSQIGNPGAYLAHLADTAGLLRSMVVQLSKANPELILPNPEVAYSMGLMHDLNATFSDYAVGGQQSKEFDEYVLAKRFGLPLMEEIALHSDYIGCLRLMTQGAEFPKREAYGSMIDTLKGDGPLSYKEIEKEFTRRVTSETGLSLITLVVADYMANGQPHFNLATFDDDFKMRSADIVSRYYSNAVTKGQTPSLLGQALVDGGLERIQSYKVMIDGFFKGKAPDESMLAFYQKG